MITDREKAENYDDIVEYIVYLEGLEEPAYKVSIMLIMGLIDEWHTKAWKYDELSY